MATEAKVVLTGDESPLRRSLASARDNLNQFGNDALQPFAKIRDALGNLGNIMAGVGAVKLIELADQAALVQARLKDVAGSFVAAQQAQQQLYAAAQRLQVSYGDMAGSFSKMLPAVKQMGGGAAEAVRLAETLAITARLSGASSQEAAASAQQFAQALQSGVLQGDELKSILENNGSLARVLADGLGVTVGELRKLGSEGELTSDKVAKALLGQYDQIQARSAELPQTVGGAWTQITNAFEQFVASASSGTGIFAGLSSIMSGLAQVIDAVRVSTTGAGTEADKLGRNNSIKQWGQAVGAVFAWVIDLGRAVVEAVQLVGKQIGALAAAGVAVARGQFGEAANIMREYANDFAESWQRIKNLTTGGQGSTLQSYALGSGTDAPGTTPTGDLKSTGGGKKDKKGKGSKADPSQMGYFEAALSEQKAVLQEHNKLLDDAKAYELAYWQQVLESAKLSEADKLAVSRKAAQLRQEIAQQESKTSEAIQRDGVDTWKQLELLKIDGQRIAAKALLDDDQITKAQFLQREIEFEERRYQVMLEYYAKRRLLNGNDPVANAKLDGDAQVEGAQHTNKVGQLRGDLGKQKAGLFDFEGAFDGMSNSAVAGFARILKGAESWRQSMLNVFTSVRDTFLKVVVLEPLNAQLAAWGRQLAAKLMFLGKEEAAQQLSSGKVVGEKVTEAMAATSANAVTAGTGAAASQAAIPVVGPALAVAAMASIFAAVMAMGGKMKSARNGYDIPAGVNPVTQLHEEEMVLPKEQANAIRNLTEGGGGQPMSVTYNDHSGRLSDDEIRRKSRVIAEELNRLHRNGWRAAT